MNWFHENRFLGSFLVALAVCLIGSLWYLWSAKNAWNEASILFTQTAEELNRLEQLAPHPDAANLRKMKAHAEDYVAAVAKLKDELRLRVPPAAPMAPNEFQSNLRVAMGAVAERARANKVKLPVNFILGFDEFAAALPKTEAAPLLGQELRQVEWLVNTLLDARVESVTSFRRAPLPDERGTATITPTPAAAKPGAALPAGPRLIERSVIDASFVSTPAAARRFLNQIASANQHFFIVRLLHVRNEKGKGPPREVTPEATGSAAATGSLAAKPPAGAALNFIVGNERIETFAKIEIVRFTF